MLSTLKNQYNKAPWILQYAAIGGGLYVAYKLFIEKNAQQTGNQNIQAATTSELATYLKNNKLSYAPSQYEQFANIIYNSTMYGLGDNYAAVRDTLKLMKNNADVAKLIIVYGSRQNYIFSIPQGGKRDLFTNLQAELGDEFFGLYSGKLNAIRDDWAKKGITYKL